MDSYVKIVFYTPEVIFSVYVPSIKVTHDGWLVNPPKRYRIRRDRADPPHAKRHYHIYENRELGVINHDGTGSHGTCSENMPRVIKKYLADIGVIIPIVLPELDPKVLNEIHVQEIIQFEQLNY